MTGQTPSVPLPVEAECFRIYRDVRDGFPERGLELGQGINEFPPAVMLVNVIAAIASDLHQNARGRDYAGWPDDVLEAACRSLIETHFGHDLPPGTRVLFTNGSSEGINLSIAALNDMGLSAMMPQPSYFVYEQSAIRYGVPLAGRYRRFRNTVVREQSGPYALVQAEPNPLDGTIAPPPDWARTDPDRRFDLLDTVFLLAQPDKLEGFNAQVRARVQRLNLTRGALLLTPSKDLSFPALRAGLVCTACPELIAYIERDQYARVFRPSPMIGYFCLFYLCVLRLFEAQSQGRFAAENDRLARWLTDLGIGGWYPRHAMAGLIAHLVRMPTHCATQFDRFRQSGGLTLDADEGDYVAGFSVFPSLNLPI
ncbi:MAG: aminotransferase class I/II-fold pyridoxal phosphate-dependent enzyme, partial [Ruegeria sp.]